MIFWVKLVVASVDMHLFEVLSIRSSMPDTQKDFHHFKTLDFRHQSQCMKHLVSISLLLLHTADAPCITTHPKGLKDAVPGQPVTFTVHATGTEPLSYRWLWKPAGEEGGSKEWQLCDVQWCNGNTLSVPSVQKSNEGSYQCIISNCAGSQISKEANLSIGKSS